MDTLMELGFRADLLEHRHPEHKPLLQVDVEQGDLTSALEIALSHGGSLCDTGAYGGESDVYTSAYDLSGISIPAHTVTEDLTDGYLNGRQESGNRHDGSDIPFDPSENDYDHFPAGIRL